MRSLLALLLVLGSVISAHAQGFAPTSSVSGGGGSSSGCDPSALSDGDVLYVASGACTGDAMRFFFDPAQGINGFLSVGMGITTAIGSGVGANFRGGVTQYLDYAHEGSVNFHAFNTANGPPSAPTASVDGDDLGEIQFKGYAGAFRDAVIIEADVDGTPGVNYVPGRLSVYTRGTATLTERLRIDSAGQVVMGGGGAAFLTDSLTYSPNVYGYDLLLLNAGTNQGWMQIASTNAAGAFYNVTSTSAGNGWVGNFKSTTSAGRLELYRNESTANKIEFTGSSTAMTSALQTATGNGLTASIGTNNALTLASAAGTSVISNTGVGGAASIANTTDTGQALIQSTSSAAAGTAFFYATTSTSGGAASFGGDSGVNGYRLFSDRSVATSTILQTYTGSDGASLVLRFGPTGSSTDQWTFNKVGDAISTGRAFASLGTPANGAFVYCSDCDAVTLLTCTSAGAKTGAFAYRLNGAWKCVGA